MLVNESYPNNWQQHMFRAMGCEMTVWLETAVADAASAFSQVESLFETHEQALSRFRTDSELSQLNASSDQWVPVSDLMWDVLTLALGMAAVTNGRFDPTTLNALEQYGYTVSFEQLSRIHRSGRSPDPALALGQWTAVALDETQQAVYLPEGVRIDFGGIAKGYTAQQAVDLLRNWGPCLVDAGGDLAAGAAPWGYPGWPVAVSAPWAADDSQPADLFTLWLADRALATSGIDYRYWQHNGRAAHHLIDPVTGQPAATDGLVATIMADDAAEAEAWATATLVAGSQVGLEALLDVELAGLMVLGNGRVLVTPLMDQQLQRLAIDSSVLPVSQSA